MASRRRDADRSVLARIPFVGGLARLIERVARRRAGPVPTGLLALLPLAILLDVFDAADELALGPVGMLLSFALETAFLLGLTGRTGYALGLSAVDLVPGVDVLPMATLTLLAEIGRQWGDPDRRAPAPGQQGPVIDV